MKNKYVLFAVLFMGFLFLGGCYRMKKSHGGGQKVEFNPPRTVNAADIALPDLYKIEAVATGLNFPTGLTFDENGRLYAIEAGYAYGGVFTAPRLLEVEGDGNYHNILIGEKNGPWTGVVYQNGYFYIAEGGVMEGGRILKVAKDGSKTVLIGNLPTMGDHHTNGPLIGRDGYLYFSLGTATNSGVVGEDNARFGWLYRKQDFHDVPCQDVTLNGQNYESVNPLSKDKDEKAKTGAFLPFGSSSTAGQVISGSIPCSGSVIRIPLTGGSPELVAWGFRNPFGLAFSPENNKLYVSDNGYDDRGSRPVWGAADLLWEVNTGTWYGWPDFSNGRPLNSKEFKVPGKDKPVMLLKNYPNEAPKAAAQLPVHASADGFDFSRNEHFGYRGDAFIAEFGDMAPDAGKVLSPVGFKVERVDVKTGDVEEFVVNRGKNNGPASQLGTHGLERPVAVRFNNEGDAMYIVDFGIMKMTEKGPVPVQNTGVIWKVTKK